MDISFRFRCVGGIKRSHICLSIIIRVDCSLNLTYFLIYCYYIHVMHCFCCLCGGFQAQEVTVFLKERETMTLGTYLEFLVFAVKT